MTDLSFGNFVLNFGFGTKEEKKALLREHASKRVVMDLTCYDPAEFYAEFPQLVGTFSALFADEKKMIEVHFRDSYPEVMEKFRELGFLPVQTSLVSCGFVFARTIVQIINEAHFALKEGVATKEDIDRAMVFGVNYPKGPFQWSRGRELYVRTLLEELLSKTGDQRYVPCDLL